MLRRIGGALASCSLVLALGWVLPADGAVPLAVLGSLPSIEDVALSPEGSRMAFVRTDQDTRLLEVLTMEGRVVAGVRIGDSKLRRILWADSNHLLLVTSTTARPMDRRRGEWYVLLDFDLRTRRLKPIPDFMQLPQVRMTGPTGPQLMVRHIDGHTVLFITSFAVSARRLVPALLRADLDGGGQQLLREGSTTTEDWLVAEDGQLAAQSDYYEQDHRWVLRIHQGAHLQEVALRSEPIDIPRVLGFGPSPDTLLVSSVEDGDTVWRLVSLKDGSVGEPMAERAQLENPIEDQGHRMIGGTYTDDTLHYVFFNPVLQKRWEAIVAAFPEEHVHFVSAAADFQKVVVRVEGRRDGFTYALVDLAAHHADFRFGSIYSGLKTVLLKKRLTYKAADGLDIPAYLTLPAGRKPTSLPLVVLVHGGPALRDTAEFDWWSQALADQGYAVLQPNYRGSAVTTRFTEAGFGQWGRKMQTDLSDGVRQLVKDGIADPARVCIVGASYGGYAALAGAALDPGVYRCAVSVAGISDIRRWLDWQAQYEDVDPTAVRYWDRFIGAKDPRDPIVDAVSPIRHIDAVNIPVLLIHGRDDTVVPYEQSTLMKDALRRAGKPVEMVTLEHEDHWLSRSRTRRQMLEECVRFLRRHDPPD